MELLPSSAGTRVVITWTGDCRVDRGLWGGQGTVGWTGNVGWTGDCRVDRGL